MTDFEQTIAKWRTKIVETAKERAEDQSFVDFNQSLLAFLALVQEKPALYVREKAGKRLTSLIDAWKDFTFMFALQDDHFEKFERWLDNREFGEKGAPWHALDKWESEMSQEEAFEKFFSEYSLYMTEELGE